MTSRIDSSTDELAEVEVWRLRLYVSGMTPVAHRTLANLRHICESHLANGYTLDVVDLLKEPQLGKIDHIIATPTLVRVHPLPPRRVIGDLSSTHRALVGLGLGSRETTSSESAI